MGTLSCGNRGGGLLPLAAVSILSDGEGPVRWTIRDIFIHINSFPKSQQNSECFIQETSFTEIGFSAIC